MEKKEKETMKYIFNGTYRCDYCKACDIVHMKYDDYFECNSGTCVLFYMQINMKEIGYE